MIAVLGIEAIGDDARDRKRRRAMSGTSDKLAFRRAMQSGRFAEMMRDANCYLAGWPDEKIQAELDMDLDEVVRLKQLTGLAALFRDREFSEAWEASDDASDE